MSGEPELRSQLLLWTSPGRQGGREVSPQIWYEWPTMEDVIGTPPSITLIDDPPWKASAIDNQNKFQRSIPDQMWVHIQGSAQLIGKQCSPVLWPCDLSHHNIGDYASQIIKPQYPFSSLSSRRFLIWLQPFLAEMQWIPYRKKCNKSTMQKHEIHGRHVMNMTGHVPSQAIAEESDNNHQCILGFFTRILKNFAYYNHASSFINLNHTR